MGRGAFQNRSLRNLLAPGAPVGHTVHGPSGELLPIWQAAGRYREAGDSVVVVAGERFGMGSSRDWAAKVQRLLGVRAVLAAAGTPVTFTCTAALDTRSDLDLLRAGGVMPMILRRHIRTRRADSPSRTGHTLLDSRPYGGQPTTTTEEPACTRPTCRSVSPPAPSS